MRVLAVLLYAYMPASSERLLTALLGQPSRGITGAKFARRGRSDSRLARRCHPELVEG